jgi:TRAP-type transport system periplasmic protein
MRRIVGLAVAVAVGAWLAGAGIGMAGTKADFTLKFGHTATEGSFTSVEAAFSNVFKSVIETKTGGRVKVELFPAGQIGGQRELNEATKLGSIEASFVADAVLGGFCPKAMLFSMPYLFTHIDDSYKLFNSPWGADFQQDCIKTAGTRVLQIAGFGFRSLTNNRRPLKSSKDVAGLKIRVMESPVPVAMIKGLGASPTPISVTELYTALQQNVVDGEENPPLVLTTYKLFEVQKYMTLNKHQLGTAAVIMNEKFYQRLPKEFQAIVNEAADLGAKAMIGLAIITNEGDALKLLNEKMEIYTPTAAEMADFKSKMQPPAQKIIVERLGEDFVNKSLEAIKKLQ